MIAAVYARKSTEQNVADDAKSVTRQVENARAFAAKRGWTVLDEHVYIDDGFSGAEFERRPGFTRMMGTLAAGAPFSVLVVSEQKSIGREMTETPYVIKQLDMAGVEVWSYMEDRCLTPRNSTDKLMTSVQGFADEEHRVKTALRVREAHSRLARSGRVTGGRLFGYRNTDVFTGVDAHGRPLRSHVDREINPEEAAVVVRIFEMYASGLGLKAIAKRLLGTPSPKYSGGSPGWAPSTVRAILQRDAYRGMLVWGRRKKRDQWGQLDRDRKRSRRPEGEWVRATRDDLRIVSEDLWSRVASRRADTEGKAVRFASGRLSGRPPKSATQNLLAGLATCGACGGGLVVVTSSGPRRDQFARLPAPGTVVHREPEPYRYYACAHRRANDTCSNKLRIPVPYVNEVVLRAVEEHALTPEAVEAVIRLTERDDVAERREAIGREFEEVEKRRKRLVEAIEAGGDAASLVARIRELEERQRVLRAEGMSCRPVPRLAPALVQGRLDEWRRLLRSSPTQGRAVLQRVLAGRIVFTPLADGSGYEFEAPTRFHKLFAGMVAEVASAPDMLSHAGLGVELLDNDADYERLLRAAEKECVKGWRPRRDSNPRSQP
jgi:site-specific DNA recombinase